MSKEAMKLALEALECTEYPQDHYDAITALREALAESQEKYQYGTPMLDAMRGKANEALDKMSENARELGLDYEPAQQEPVAWLEPEWGEKICPEVGYEVTMTEDHPRDLCWVPLYPHPAQRTWVGLTDEEFQWVYDHGRTPAGMMEMVEAKLKEKNNG